MMKHWILNRSPLTKVVVGIVPKYLSNEGHLIGTAALVVHVTVVTVPVPVVTLFVTGLCRIKVDQVIKDNTYPMGTITRLDKMSAETLAQGIDERLLQLKDSVVSEFREMLVRYLETLDDSPSALKLKAMLITLPVHHAADVCASVVRASSREKFEILDCLNVSERLKKTTVLISKYLSEGGIKPLKSYESEGNANRQVQIINEEELGSLSDSSKGDELKQLERKLEEANLPLHAYKVAMEGLKRLKKMPRFSREKESMSNYLELMADLPWNKSSVETIDIYKAREDLDADHHAMDQLKQRVLEYLAVRKLKNTLCGPILCFVGSPGVGKSSVGRSIAHTLGREFHRISLGGICNQSDIRGHRRTYVGAMPGRIIQGLKIVGVNNPVFLLDEIDKLGVSQNGNPAAALLEVLDPEQNCNFVDHYLNVPFDLSQVLFIATANTVKSIPLELLDRMELINVPGYSLEEKLHIASKHLLPKQLDAHGLSTDLIAIPEESIKMLISDYTHEAGVRTLERKLGALCRAIAVLVAEERFPSESGKEVSSVVQTFPVTVDAQKIESILGPAIFSNADLWNRLGNPGVAVGLAWTTAGGEVLLVEANKMEGDGQLVLTGHLGSVMKESARIALNWVRTQHRKYGLDLTGETLAQTDVHIHIPAGAVEKDGPSAGITIATALISLFSNKPVSSDVATTGEITLQGVVLPVDGIKAKVLAAHRAGMRRVILPRKCEKDLLEVPASVKKDVTFIFASHIDEVLQAAFDGGFPLDEDNPQRVQVRSKL